MSAWVLVEFRKSRCAYNKGERTILTLKVAEKLRDKGLIKILRQVEKP